jgi:2-amino-4-hydroxy-6-hydroxymethyldihydropteridine diphosphokinase
MRFAIALGSNLGDRAHHLRSAVTEIEGLGEVVGMSGLYETAPVGGPDQDPFLNAVVVVDVDLTPEALLDRLQSIESKHGRERSVHWGPRTLDLDLVASEGPPVDVPGLQIPHPRAAERRFVLEPLSEIWPDAPVGGGVTARQALDRIHGQEVDLLLPRWFDPPAPKGRYWVAAQFALLLAIGVVLFFDGSLPAGDRVWLSVVGGVLFALGLWVAITAARDLGRSLTPMPEPLARGSLVEDGLYAYARHPIYGGVVLAMLGAAVLLGSSWAALLVAVLVAFFWAKSGYEERALRLAYPGYLSYRERVGKRLIPFVL